MTRYSAGEASIRILPDATSFLRDLEAKLRAMRDPNFTVEVKADTSQAARDTDAFRREQSARGVDVDVDADTAGATAELTRWRASQEANDIHLRVEVDVDRAGAQLAGLSRQLETLGRSDILRLNVGAGLVAGIGPALTGLAQLAAALQQVSQAGLALPGVFAGAGASIGTLALGLSGIKDAYDAVSDAATSSGKDQETQARAAVSASNNLRNAVVDEARAREDVARATRRSAQELRDLRTEQRGGMIDESRAILEAQKAREDLAQGNYSDIRDATLRVAEADQRLIEVRNRNATTAERLNDANAKGVTGSDQVRDANERLARAQQQVAEAQAAAATTATQNSAAQDKAAEAMGKLGPNAQRVVETMVALKPAFQEFRNAISDPLLEGKAEEFQNFFTTIRPVAQRGLAGIATGWNQNITALLGAVGSDTGTGLIDRILGNTGDAQAKLSAAMQPLVEGLGTLTAAGTDVLPRLADGFAAVMDRFRNFIVAADEDGRLDQWINDGIDGMRMLGESFLNIGKSFTAITQAAGGGQSFLQWLQDATGRLQTFLNSAEGQNKLTEFFERGRHLFEQWRPILQDIPTLMKGVYDGASLYIGGLAAVVSPITEFLKGHPDLVKAAAAAYVAFKTIDGVTSLIGNLTTINNLLGTGGKNGRGGKGIIGKLALLSVGGVALSALLDDETPSPTPPSAGQIAGDAATNIAGGAIAGGMAAGPPGAVAGAVAGAGKSVIDRATGDLERGREAARNYQPVNPPVPQHFDQGRTPALEELRAKIAAGQLPGYSLSPDGTIIGPDGKPVTGLPGFARGGQTPGPRHRGFLAELHGQEWIHDAPTVDFYGRDVMNALWRKQIDPNALKSLVPGFWWGGPTDPNDPNYVGIATGQAVGGAASGPATTTQHGAGGAPGPVAPNPFTATPPGVINDATGQAVNGAQTPMQTIGSSFLSSMGINLPGQQTSTDSATDPKLTPGLWGLIQAGNDPLLQQQWQKQTLDWLVKDWVGGTIVNGLMNNILPNVLGAVGLGGILNSPYVSAFSKTLSHFMSKGGPQQQQGNAASSGTVTLPDGTQVPAEQFLTPGQTYTTNADGTTSTTLNPGSAQQLYSGTGIPNVNVSGANSGGLQINTARGKAIIQQMFPWATNIGGVRADAKKWHPSGLALDVMIPGAGGLNDPTPPAGKAMGDQLYAWLMANKQALGIDYILWQEKDHYNHLHVNFAPSGYAPGGGPAAAVTPPSSTWPKPGSGNTSTAPTNAATTPVAPPPKLGSAAKSQPKSLKDLMTHGFAVGGPTPPGRDRAFPAILHGDEFVISARGRANVPDEFLHKLNRGEIDGADLPQFAIGGDVRDLIAGIVTRPKPRPDEKNRGKTPIEARPKLPVAQQPPRRTPDARPLQPAPPVAETPPSAPHAGTGAAPGPEPATTQQTQGPYTDPVAPPMGVDYTLPWVNRAIESGAATLGNIAATAAEAAAAAGTFGGSAAVGALGAMGGGGGVGSMVAGLFQQGGKVVQGVANVISGALVGSVPGSFMTTPEVYGRTMRTEQRQLATGQSRVANYNVTAVHPDNLMAELRLHESIEQQSALAAHPGRI